jgi:hypothetical protein
MASIEHCPVFFEDFCFSFRWPGAHQLRSPQTNAQTRAEVRALPAAATEAASGRPRTASRGQQEGRALRRRPSKSREQERERKSL